MIKAYLAAISSIYEGEDIEIRYSIYEDEELICRESILMEYQKPAIIGYVGMITLLKEFEKEQAKEIVVIINDPALYEFIRGTSKPKNKDIQEMGMKTKKALSRYKNITIKDVHGDRTELMKWDEILK